MDLSSSNKQQQRRVGTGRIIGSARFEPYRRPAARRFFRLDGGADEDDDHQHDAPGPIRHRRRPIYRRPHVINPYRVDDLTTEQLLERHVTIIDSYVQHVQKFNVDGYQTRFVLRDLDKADNPVRVLERVMDHLMGIAKDNSAEAGYEVIHIGIAFTVEGMQSDFLIPFRPPAENNAEKVSTAIDEKDKSDKEDSVTVYDKEMTLLITTVKDIRVDDEATCSSDSDEDEDDDEDDDAPELTDLNDDIRPPRRIRRQQERATTAAKKRRGRKKLMYIPGKSIIENALIRIPDDDTRCLFFALVISRQYNIAMQDEQKKNAGKTRSQIASMAYQKTNRLLNNRQLLIEEALDLMEAARIPQGQPDYGTKDAKKVQEYFNKSWPGLFRIVIFGERSGTKAIFNGDVNAKYNRCLYHNDAHFDVIKSPAQFFDRKFYCVDCEMPFSQKNTHTMHCRVKCLRCLRMGHGFPCPKKDGETIECPDSRLIFNNLNCYEHHKRSACKEYKRCLDCGIVYRPYQLAKHGGHRCGTSYCHTCASYHPSYEPCFIPPLEFIKTKKEEKKTLKKKKWNCYVDEEGVAFDFESEIHEKTTAVKERHAPNYASMHITCSKCITEGVLEDFEKTDCECCGPQKVYSFAAWELPEGKTVVDAMLDVLPADLPKDFKTYAYAHNGAKYDTPFIMQALAKRGGTMPKVTQRGNKVIEVRIQKTRNFNALTIRDSVMLFPMKLADCPETFDLRRNAELIMAKTFFPYRYNRAENYGVRRNGLPPMADCIPETMSKKEKKEFQAWYAAHQNDAFDLCAEFGEYCSND